MFCDEIERIYSLRKFRHFVRNFVVSSAISNLFFKDENLPELYLNTQSVPRSKHCVWVIKTSQLMLYREIMAVCSQIHTKHINTVCGQNVEL